MRQVLWAQQLAEFGRLQASWLMLAILAYRPVMLLHSQGQSSAASARLVSWNPKHYYPFIFFLQDVKQNQSKEPKRTKAPESKPVKSFIRRCLGVFIIITKIFHGLVFGLCCSTVYTTLNAHPQSLLARTCR